MGDFDPVHSVGGDEIVPFREVAWGGDGDRDDTSIFDLGTFARGFHGLLLSHLDLQPSDTKWEEWRDYFSSLEASAEQLHEYKLKEGDKVFEQTVSDPASPFFQTIFTRDMWQVFVGHPKHGT